MSKTAKIILLVSSLICGGTFTFFILAFGGMVEPDEHGLNSVLFAIVAGIVLSTPLWLPATIPNHFKITSMIFRWLGAIALIYLILMFGSSLVNSIERYVNDRGPSLAGFIVGVIPATLCIVSITLLIWPEVGKL